MRGGSDWWGWDWRGWRGGLGWRTLVAVGLGGGGAPWLFVFCVGEEKRREEKRREEKK